MEFKFRANENKGSSYIPPSSAISLSTDHALRAAALNIGVCNTNDMIEREIEKRKIREEILRAEIQRQWELEAEVRREMMLERTMMKRDGFSLFNSSTSLLQSGLGVLPLHCLERVGIQERLSIMDHTQVGGSQCLPFQQQEPAFSLLTELKSSSVPEVSEKEMVLINPINLKAGGMKRKAETVATSSDARKKAQNKWRCALCQVNTTSEHSLNEHLQGKKHKSKETKAAKDALPRASKAASRMSSVSSLPDKIETSTEQAVPTFSLNPKDKKSLKRTEEVMENVNDVVQNMENIEAKERDSLGGESGKGIVGSSNLKNEGSFEMAVALKVENTEDLMINCDSLFDRTQQNLKFWCKMCKVGTNNEKSMEAHRSGEIHRNLLKKNGGGLMVISTVPMNVKKVEETFPGKGGKEELKASAKETEGTVAKEEKKDSLNNTGGKTEVEAKGEKKDEVKKKEETEAKEEKKDSLCNTDEKADGLEVNGEEDADGEELTSTSDNHEIPCAMEKWHHHSAHLLNHQRMSSSTTSCADVVTNVH